jgi:hypothetical protein
VKENMENKKSSKKVIELTIIGLIFSLIIVSCISNKETIEVNRSDPENVLRAYFDAWEKGEWEVQLSMMDEKYKGMTPEPVNKLNIISIKPITSITKEDNNYRVIFDIEVVGGGVSMNTGRYDWNYYLRWNEIRKSWLIINYGVG